VEKKRSSSKAQENNSPSPPLNLRGGWGALLDLEKGIVGSRDSVLNARKWRSVILSVAKNLIISDRFKRPRSRNKFGMTKLTVSKSWNDRRDSTDVLVNDCHCEHPKGAWQSHLERPDCFASLAMTILIVGFLLISPIIAGATTDDYVIGDGDTLQISVWGSPELSTGATVRPDGKITLPAV